MLLSVLNVQHEPEAMERRFGFRGVRPLAGDTGQERFGVLELAGGAQAAVLRLHGRDLSLAEPRALRDTVEGLGAGLPGRAVQFLLSRRVGQPALGPALHAALAARLGDRPAVAEALWTDYSRAQAPRLAEAGLADLWAGVALAAPDAATLTQQVAALYLYLPYEAAPLPAHDLGRLVHRLLRPDAPPPPPVQAVLPWPLGTGEAGASGVAGLVPRTLLLDDNAVSLAPGVVTSYWLLLPPFPAAPGGWAWRLLESPALRAHDWDLAIHLRPGATAGEAMRTVLEDRLARVTADLAHYGGASPERPPPGASHDTMDAWLLELERRELLDRLAGLGAGRDRLRDATVLLALHTPAADHATLSPGGTYRDRWLAQMTGEAGPPPAAAETLPRLAAALAAAELVARPVRGKRTLAQSVRAMLPLAAPEGLRAFPVTGAHAAGLALLPPAAPPALPPAPLLGVARDGTLYGPFPEAEDLPGHRLIVGGANGARRRTVAQWALAAYTAGLELLIYDPRGRWDRFTAALGGRVLRPGAADQAGVADLLALPLAALNQATGFEAWGRELAGLFAALLARRTGQPADVIESQIGAALLQLGLRAVTEGATEGLTLAALRAELENGGYTTTAHALAALLPGGLHATEGRLFTPGPPPPDAGLLCIGPPDPALPPPAGPLAAAIALRRALAAPPAAGWRVCLLDPLSAAPAHAALAADLAEALTGGPPDRTSFWGVLPPADLPLLHGGPHAALGAAFGQQIFLAPGESLTGSAAALGVPPAACARLATLVPPQALACQDGECTLLTVVLGEWVGRVLPG
jgi:hypothetical protein